jgi:hypothetical protein
MRQWNSATQETGSDACDRFWVESKERERERVSKSINGFMLRLEPEVKEMKMNLAVYR